jgi:hypothetical protein
MMQLGIKFFLKKSHLKRQLPKNPISQFIMPTKSFKIKAMLEIKIY